MLIHRIKNFYTLNFPPPHDVTESVRQVQARTLLVLLSLTFVLSFPSILQEYEIYSPLWTSKEWQNYLLAYIFYECVVLTLIISLYKVAQGLGAKMYDKIEKITLFAAYFLSFQIVFVSIIGLKHGLNPFIICGAAAGYATLLLLTNTQRILYLVSIFSVLAIGIYVYVPMATDLYIQYVVTIVLLSVILYLIGHYSYLWYTSNKDKTIKLEAAQNFQLKMLNQWAKDFNIEPINFKKKQSLFQLNEQVYKLLDAKIASEQELTETLNHLQKANKSLMDYAHVVSHDLKTPLRAISTLAYFLDEDFGNQGGAEMKEITSSIMNRVTYMDNLISDLLNYAQLEEGVTVNTLNPMEQINRVIEIIGQPEKGFIAVQGEFPCIEMGQHHFQQIIQNLITNALIYNNKDCKEIKITGKDLGEHVEISIADNGNGIGDAHFDKIFDLFQSLEEKTNDSTGIGLAIVKKILDLYKSEISVQSSLGIGSVFKLKFLKNLPHKIG